MNRDREDIQMVGLFVVIVVMRRLRPGAPQPPYGVARRHEPRKPVPRHDATRASRGAATSSRRYSQCSPRDNTRTGQDQQVGSRNQISRAALTKLTALPDKNYIQHYEQKAGLNITTEYHKKRWQAKLRGRRLT